MEGGTGEKWRDDLLQSTFTIFTSYEDLVKELQLKLEKTKEELLQQSSKSLHDREELCLKCSKLGILIKNQMTQVESLKMSNKLISSMWESSIEEIEDLEKEFVLNPSNLIVEQTGREQLIQEMKKQIILLKDHTKIMSLEMEKMGNDKAFYQNKMLEEKAENEEKMREMLEKADKDIQNVKSGYKGEIAHLQETIAKMRVEQKRDIEIKVEEERENMVREEKNKMKMVKDELWAKLNPLMLECEFLGSSEQIFKDQLNDAKETIEKIEKENSDLTLANSQLKSQVSSLNKEIENFQLDLKNQFMSKAAEEQLKMNQKGKSNSKSNLESRTNINEKPIKTYDSSFLHKYKDDDESFDKMILQEVRKEKNRLQDEHLSLKESNHHLKREVEGIIIRLEERNRDLESLNHDLQLQLIEKTNNIKPPSVQNAEETLVQEKKSDKEIIKLKESLEALEVKDDIKSRTWEIRESNLRSTIENLIQEKNNLLSLIESHKKLSSKWESEYKSLFMNTEKYRRKKTR